MGVAGELHKKLIDTKSVIVILGPTASGKTGTAVELNKLLDIQVISADSRQIYKHLSIGTAKPDADELEAVSHHLVDFLDLTVEYSAGQFEKDAEKAAKNILENNKIPALVGGSGLYIQAFCEGLFDEGKEKDIEVRNKIEERMKSEGIDPLYDELMKYDPELAERYPDKNPRRITRALEYYYTTGVPLSRAHKLFSKKKEFNCIKFGIDVNRELLYDKINKRAELMWENGLIEETKGVLEMGYSASLNSLNTVGYKECIAYLNGDMSSEEALDKMKINTRRYAKRQITWFKRFDDIIWLSGTNDKVAGKIVEWLKNSVINI
jgi:tRNA dimethylallyltransferase